MKLTVSKLQFVEKGILFLITNFLNFAGMSNNFKENLAQERLECQDRMERRAIRDRIAIDRGQGVKHSMLRKDLTLW